MRNRVAGVKQDVSRGIRILAIAIANQNAKFAKGAKDTVKGVNQRVNHLVKHRVKADAKRPAKNPVNLGRKRTDRPERRRRSPSQKR